MDLIPFDEAPAPGGLALAERGDWHAAAHAFAAALDDAEQDASPATPRPTRTMRLAVALTNLGQARAYLGALDDAAALLARSAAVREALVSAGHAHVAVAVRGHMDLAAVYGAAGDVTVARASLRRARALLDEAGRSEDELARRVDEGMTLLGG